MAIPGYVDYQRREFCKALPCIIQQMMDRAGEGTPAHEEYRSVCKARCIHSTYEFHHWLMERGYEIVRPGPA